MLKSIEILNREGKALLYNAEKCLGCGLCIDICKNLRNAIELAYPTENPGKTEIILKAEQCSACGWCAINCPFGALEFKINGEKVAVERWLLQEVKVHLEKCMCCGRCEEVCPRGAIEVDGKMKIVTRECTYCGLCEDPCPTGAIRVDPTKRKVEIDASSCIRCGACEQFCPTGVIKISCLDCLLCLGETTHAEKKSHLRVESAVNVDNDKCIYCGVCELSCPTKAIKITKPFEGHISIKTAKCPKDCTICIDFCLCGAIEKRKGIAVINEDACIYCGACYRVCPSKAIDFERESVGIIDNKGHLILYV
jgi:4Fe-4S ferredoxin